MKHLAKLTDNSLVSRLQDSDQEVYRLLFERHYKNLVIKAYQILKDENLSKDAAQDVFVALWNARKNLNSDMNFSSYLGRAVVNRSINQLKSRRHHATTDEAQINLLSTTERSPSQRLEDEELKTVLQQAINSMPDKCREIFMLCRMDQLSHKEIAQELGISTKTIENQMTKALKIIRAAIAKYKSMTLILFFVALGWGNFVFERLLMYGL